SPDLSAYLPAADDTGARSGGRICIAAGVERLPLPVHAAFIDTQHDGGGGHQSVLRQRRGAMELYDGSRSGLFPAADRDLLCIAPVHVIRAGAWLAPMRRDTSSCLPSLHCHRSMRPLPMLFLFGHAVAEHSGTETRCLRCVDVTASRCG